VVVLVGVGARWVGTRRVVVNENVVVFVFVVQVQVVVEVVDVEVAIVHVLFLGLVVGVFFVVGFDERVVGLTEASVVMAVVVLARVVLVLKFVERVSVVSCLDGLEA
jgi:hypothetical protein